MEGGFVRFSNHRFGFMDGITPVGTMLDAPKNTKPTKPFVYRGFYRHGKRVVFSYRLGDVDMLDAPWVKDGRFVREIAPADKHSLAHLTRGGNAQWPSVLTTTGSLGANRPYAIDTITPPFKNPWNALFFFGGHDFFPDGSAALCTMQGDVWHVEGLDASLKNVRWRRMASGLHHALGLVVADRAVYVLGRDQITRLVDLNGDGEVDFYECFSSAYVTSPAGHDFICGLERDQAGNFYTASGNQGLLPHQSRRQASRGRCDRPPQSRRAGVAARCGSLTVSSSEGDWTPASRVCEVKPDRARKIHFGYGGPIDKKAAGAALWSTCRARTRIIRAAARLSSSPATNGDRSRINCSIFLTGPPRIFSCCATKWTGSRKGPSSRLLAISAPACSAGALTPRTANST